jgi:hypothetical protein
MTKIWICQKITVLQSIYDSIIITDYNDKINNINLLLLDIKTFYVTKKQEKDNINNFIDLNLIIDDKIKEKYNNISNYELYINDKERKLENYDLIKNNKEVKKIFDDFNKCINNNCNNCINHSKTIKHFYKKYNIDDNLKKEYIIIKKYHLILKSSKLNKNILERIIEDLVNQIENYKNIELNNKNIIMYKNDILDTINNIKNSNILYKIEELENSENLKYKELMEELKLFEIYNKELTDLVNYKYNLEIYNKIENNQEIELIKETISNIDNNELYNNRYIELNNLIDILTLDINNKKQKHYMNNNNYNILLDRYNKYNEICNKIIVLEKEQIIYNNIINLTGIKGIPRKIINIKLSYVE